MSCGAEVTGGSHLVWTKHSDDLAETFSTYLGAQDFLVKSNDEQELRGALNGLLSSSHGRGNEGGPDLPQQSQARAARK